MAIINDLIAQIEDEGLRQRIDEELKRLLKQKKFGLVFEEHQPEGLTEGPVYPYLQMLDQVNRAPGDKLWHILIESDNYYALQLLVYLYAGMVDCIYIDPPYNTGARDWKYNNDYVDSSDQYRHSKWLSMMKRRLKLAKKLLNPQDSVLIVTIDEKEYLHLGCLLEEMFPEARMQMVSVAIHSAGVSRQEFSRTDEYYFFVFFGDASPKAIPMGEEWNADGVKRQNNVRWESLLRSGNNGRRQDRPNLFYPVLIDTKTQNVVGFGESLPINMPLSQFTAPEGLVAVFPRASDGSEACWRISASKAMELQKIGAFDMGEYRGENTTLKYLKPGELAKIDKGEYKICGFKGNGAMILSADGYKPRWIPGTQWHVSTHESGGSGGSGLIKSILGNKRFDFPKSVYAVRDSLKFFVANKPNALIVDFFAGSGTTLHAVNLLNAEDGGHRRCIMVTNNEVSDQEAKALTKQGFKPGDDEWEQLGIARYVNWPRTVCSIEGHDVNGQPLKGEYLGSDHRQMKDGFEANCAFFKLGFLDKTQVALGRQFRELLPLLWMKAGAIGPCPQLNSPLFGRGAGGEAIPEMLVLPENAFAVLTDEKAFSRFAEQVNADENVRMVYLVVDSDSMYKEMAHCFPKRQTCQLYRDYLDNFRINPTR